MYSVFCFDTLGGFCEVVVRRNGEFLASARGATPAQALREVKRQVRAARHAGEFTDAGLLDGPCPLRAWYDTSAELH